MSPTTELLGLGEGREEGQQGPGLPEEPHQQKDGGQH